MQAKDDDDDRTEVTIWRASITTRDGRVIYRRL